MLLWHFLACVYMGVVRRALNYVENDPEFRADLCNDEHDGTPQEPPEVGSRWDDEISTPPGWSQWNPPYELVECGWFWDQYIYSFYWSVMAVAGNVPELPDVNPDTVIQQTVTMLVTFIGLLAGGWIMGSITNLISSMDAEANEWQTKTDEAVRFILSQGVPPNVVEKVRNYYEYMWTMCRSSVKERPTLINLLPHKLQTEVTIFLNKSIFDEIPLLQLCTSPLSQILFVRCLVHQIEMPESVVCKQGSFGDGLFFLMRGELSVSVWVSPGDVDDEHLAHFDEDARRRARGGYSLDLPRLREPGTCFGENSLLDASSMHITSMRTVAFVELMKLPVDKFHQLIDDEPEIFESLTESASSFSLDVARRVRETPPPDFVNERTTVLPVGVQRIAPDDSDENLKFKRRPSKLQAIEKAALKAVSIGAFFRGAKKKERDAKKQHDKNRACIFCRDARALRSSHAQSLLAAQFTMAFTILWIRWTPTRPTR